MRALDYAMANKGAACIRFRATRKSSLLFGYSAQYEDEIFYFIENNGEIDGPYYFGSRNDCAKSLLRSYISPKDIVSEPLPERRVIG